MKDVKRWLDNFVIKLSINSKPVAGRLRKNSGNVISFLTFSSQYKATRELIELRARVYDDVPEGRIITDANTVIIDVNPAFTKITGYSREEIIGKTPKILSSGLQSKTFYALMWRSLQEQGHWQGEVWNRKKNGDIYAERLNIVAFYDQHHSVSHYVGLLSDITSNKRQQEQLDMLAHYDVLTQLPNRALIVDRFKQAMAQAKRSQTQLAVCFLDLDNFKPINDSYGHHVGDSILIEISRRMTHNIRESDTVSRQGGDEFALLLTDIDSFAHCEQSLRRILDAISQPVVIDDISHTISASIGVTMYPADSDDFDTLLRHADHAMYEAKQSGRNRYQLYNVEQDQLIVFKHHRLLEIEQALLNGEFQLYYQPKVNMLTGDVFGVEALLRWNHPEQGILLPVDFLPIIAGTALEKKLGDWVIEYAVKQLNEWQEIELRPEVSINISSNHLLSSSFFDNLKWVLNEHPLIKPNAIQLEILESSALGDLKAIHDVLERCISELGISAALDDFGTGYSSLTHLRALPANIIKIDQSFVRDLLDDPHDYSIIDGVIGLAEAFRREVIAEGVETTEQGLMLIVMGCLQAQGYVIAKPMPADEFPRWLQNYRPNQAWLECADRQFSPKEKQLKLLKLATSHWHNKFVEYIKSPQDSALAPPIMDIRKCHCGTCITWLKQEKLLKKGSMVFLKQLHETFHQIADSIFHHYQQNDLQTARAELHELQQAFFIMHSTVEQYKTVT